MKRLQININVLNRDTLKQAKDQHPGLFDDCNTIKDVALKIRDEYNLKHCTRVLDSLIFTEIKNS